MRTGTLTSRPRNHAEPAVRPTTIRPMQRIGRGIVHPTSLTQTLEHRGIPPAIASPIFVNPLVEFIHLLRSSAPNSLLSSCRASSTACFSFLMVFTIPGRTSRASGDLSIPEMVSFRWFGACRSAAAESAKPCRIHLCDGDSPIVMKCERSLLSVSRPHDPSGRLLLLCTGTVNIKYVEQTGTRPYPCGPKWSTRSDGKAQ